MEALFKALIWIQQNLQAPKSEYNSFGKYNYRSLESILSALKPLLAQQHCGIRFADDVVEHGGRTFVRSTLYFFNDKGESISTTAEAEHSATKTGMDSAQITGAASSYARKYALNGLFAIDDSKDDDVPPALPDKREDFEAYADKVYGKREKEQAIENNQKKLDDLENWRYISADHIEVKMKNGQWINLDNCQLKWLESLLENEAFDGIKADIQKRICNGKRNDPIL